MRKRLMLAFLFLLLALSLTLHAQTAVNLVGDEIASRIDKIFARVNQQDCPGCAIGIAKDGAVVFTRGYGLANLEYGVPITPATIFEAGSVSKQFTACAILLLVQKGKLSLDDDIRKFLPEIPDFKHKITVRHLLNHTSGLRDQWGLLTAAGRPPGSAVHTLDEILDLVSRQKDLNFTPGTEYLYCNTGFALLAWIVQRAGGKSLAEFSRSEIFVPLKMNSTEWRDDYTRIVKGRATAYIIDAGGAFHTNMSFTNVYGNGGLLTTVGDLLTWNQNFVTPQVLGRDYLNRMQQFGKLNDGQEIDYGLGLTITEYKGLREISHGGSTAGYRAYLARFPEQRLSVSLLCNLGNLNTESLVHQIADVFLEGQFNERKQPERIALNPAELQKKAGLYRNLATDAILRIQFKDGKLFIPGGAAGTELIPVAVDRFLAGSDMELKFENSSTGAPPQVLQIPIRGKTIVYTAVAAATPTAEQLQDYRGDYYSPELEVVYRVSCDSEGRLYMRHRPEPPVRLNPVYADAFSTSDGGRIVRFTRNKRGKIDGLSVYAGRVRHLRFVRRS